MTPTGPTPQAGRPQAGYSTYPSPPGDTWWHAKPASDGDQKPCRLPVQSLTPAARYLSGSCNLVGHQNATRPDPTPPPPPPRTPALPACPFAFHIHAYRCSWATSASCFLGYVHVIFSSSSFVLEWSPTWPTPRFAPIHFFFSHHHDMIDISRRANKLIQGFKTVLATQICSSGKEG